MKSRNVYSLATVLVAFSLASPLVFAAPQISQVTSQSLEQGGTLTIQGSGFVRESSDPHAVMFDMVDKAYINGETNTHHESFDELDPVLRIDEDPDTLWWKPSRGSTDALQAPSIVRDLDGRGIQNGALYHLKGYNSWLGWPSAYGGNDTPADNTKLYVAWYLKMSYDPRYYWTVSPLELEGQFIPNEKIIVNGFEGRYIGIGTEGHSEGMLHFEILGKGNTNDIRGEEIVGQSSGASTVFPTDSARGTGVGFENPGSNKYLRVWEDPQGKEGIRLSWTQMTVHDEWEAAPVTPGEWHLMEFMLDTDEGVVRAYTDRQLVAEVDVSDKENYPGKWSPTIALLGFNGKTQEFQDIQIDDIYMDSSFSRVVIGDKPKYSELDHYELQYPIKWKSGEIEVRLNFGAIDPKTQAYLYVVDESGKVNEEGFSLCDDCRVPPSKVQLDVN
ncbi:hypothetical protein [Marinobacter sp. HL-58]|uniref:hypothetical protein n=1 Tax=Marinobacter sp. HL-58 TaxID=1479237 RepID=UPI00047F9F46|nr:hypothetical protein [Marinobacter sp. HL-58]KPQ01362.1 MAG: hypothetical protein HLUCCO03_13215 [Marinobacter sp. HL-58]